MLEKQFLSKVSRSFLVIEDTNRITGKVSASVDVVSRMPQVSV